MCVYVTGKIGNSGNFKTIILKLQYFLQRPDTVKKLQDKKTVCPLFLHPHRTEQYLLLSFIDEHQNAEIDLG